MLRNHRNVVALAPHLQLFNRRRAEGITRRQHYRFTLLLELTRQFADSGGFPDTVNANHQNNKWCFAFNIKRFVNFCENFTHLVFQQAIQRFGVAQLFAARPFGQVGDDLTGGFHPNVRDQQLLFQLFKQIVVDLFAAEQTDKSGT